MSRRDDQAAERILRHWQTEFPNDRLAHLVRDASRVLAKSLQARLAEYSVSFGHWSFLRVLWYSEGLTQRELSEEVGLMEPTTYTALKAMEKKGLIERRHQGGNQKNLHIYLTDKGRALKDELIPIAEELNEISVRGLSEEERRMVHYGLLTIIRNLFEAGAVS
ncbi:MAG: MarR family transcriptional regulator [Alcanivorax sp.]|nr:MarR family transcriptional regulator [Alcanivorax sp.]